MPSKKWLEILEENPRPEFTSRVFASAQNELAELKQRSVSNRRGLFFGALAAGLTTGFFAFVLPLIRKAVENADNSETDVSLLALGDLGVDEIDLVEQLDLLDELEDLEQWDEQT